MSAKGLEYQAAVGTCALVGTMLLEHDIPGMLAAIDKAEAVGPMLDPTLYRQKMEAMEQDKRLLEAALPLYRWAQVQKAIVDQKGAKAS